MSSRANSDLAVYDASLREEFKGVKTGRGTSANPGNAEPDAHSLPALPTITSLFLI
jgi:hypothetical protein